LFPTGDQHGKMVAAHQPSALAAMEGKFETSSHAELAIIGQPNTVKRTFQRSWIYGALYSRRYSVPLPHLKTNFARTRAPARSPTGGDIMNALWYAIIAVMLTIYVVPECIQTCSFPQSIRPFRSPRSMQQRLHMVCKSGFTGGALLFS